MSIRSAQLRTPRARQRSMSLDEYAPLALDRDALEEAYRQSVGLDTDTGADRSRTASAGSSGAPSTAAAAVPARASPGTRPTSYTASSASASHASVASRSTASNPSTASYPSITVTPRRRAPPPPAPVAVAGERNLAGVGAHHSLSPPPPPSGMFSRPASRYLTPTPLASPHPGLTSPRPPALASPPPMSPASASTVTASPVLATPTAAQFQFQAPTHPDRLSPIVGSPPYYAPPLPARPQAGEGAWSDGDDTQARRKRRALPPVPTNVSRPVPPEWQPDYKPAIPPSLVAPSVEHAYAQLSAPPPNLPARRTQPPRAASRNVAYYLSSPSTSAAGNRRPATRRTSSTARRLSRLALDEMPRVLAPAPDPASRVAHPPLTAEPEAGPSRAGPIALRPTPETEVTLRATGRTPIWSTHYFDPALRPSLMSVPHPVSAAADAALSGLAAYPPSRFNATIGAPIDGLAKLAKSWVVPPDGRFEADAGGVELGIGVIDRGGQEWGNQKGRKKARVEVATKSGGVKVDVLELDTNRQIDLRITTKSGDVLVLLPPTFRGPLHLTTPARAPTLLPRLLGQCEPMANPYEAFWTTYVRPLPADEGTVTGNAANSGAGTGVASTAAPRGSDTIDVDAPPAPPADGFPFPPPPPASARPVAPPTPTPTRRRTGASDHARVSSLAKLPALVREQADGDYLTMAGAGYAAWSRAGESKVVVGAAKGRVVLGYRGGRDEDEAAGLGLRVGAKEEGKRKRWWRG
ncbi:hypothetical protein Q5752_001020 [Cryptotrichosporon argae]